MRERDTHTCARARGCCIGERGGGGSRSGASSCAFLGPNVPLPSRSVETEHALRSLLVVSASEERRDVCTTEKLVCTLSVREADAMNAGSRCAAIGDLGLVSEIIERKKYTIAEFRCKLGLTYAEIHDK